MILTTQQQAVVDHEGNFLLLACPGSGKTRSAAERSARLAKSPGMKLAVCSFTNVGADRIGGVLAQHLGVVLEREHFLGTIHRFLQRYVLWPYAHLRGAKRGPTIKEGSWPDLPVHGDNKQRMTLDSFRYTPDGSLVVSDRPRWVSGSDQEIIASVGKEVTRRKTAIFEQQGLLTPDDAMFVALRILREYPDTARAVARRFDEVLLDEAQDTSELQLACLDALHATGELRSLVLVGDLEQSIYSFQGASAERCAKLAEDRCLDVLRLTENHRSSQLICDAAVNFCGRSDPDIAVGPHAACEIPPEVALYPPNDPGAALDIYRERLAAHGIPTSDATVLGRNWKVVNAINGQSPLFDESDRRYHLGQLASRLAEGKLTRSDVVTAERLIAYCSWDETHLADLAEDKRAALRKAAGELLRRLPQLDGDLSRWLIAARSELGRVATSLNDPPARTGGQAVNTNPEYENLRARDVFSPAPQDLSARTVHSFKGEDSDAVMVVIRRYIGNDPTAQLDLLEAAASGSEPDAERQEEQRVLFVALTRARRYCLVALPDDERGRSVATSCEALGFQLATNLLPTPAATQHEPS